MFAWYVARRLYSHSGDVKRVSRPAIQIATAGVAVGVAIMIVSVCIVLGFQTEIRNKVFGFGSHIQVINYETTFKSESAPIVVDDSLLHTLSAIPGVHHVQRFCVKAGMLKTEETFRGVVFRGVGEDYDTSFLRQHLVEGEIPVFSDTVMSNRIVLSRELARQLRVKVGDRVYAYFFEQAVRARRFTITGIYCTNMNDFDESLVFTDLETVHTLCRWDSGQYSGVEIAIDDFNELDAVSARVESKVNHTQDAYGASYSSPTIVDLYPTIFSWLSLLDMDVIVILILMVLVSGFTMVSGLLIIILERTNFIGVMKALGASNSTLRHLFLYFAAFIVIRGLIIGNIVAFALMLLQKYTGFIHLDPESYYMDTVPLLIHWGYIVLINVSTLFICVLALIMPSYLISNIHPARSIRFE